MYRNFEKESNLFVIHSDLQLLQHHHHYAFTIHTCTVASLHYINNILLLIRLSTAFEKGSKALQTCQKEKF